ncbi:TonB-linked outer membrane protein, SusC/RagA family [Flavobacterium micromati]|uniref:TonB-linked outer membrane protein, SusC/RagA family n=1 Tax=Flavobacterium micromati TaxID=229205 RepID=A0A1M5K9V8_9FLAO|nr:SusC/RagA family TonB-linked outer membrane protein [Flavobacterium micromati]SHG49642.1 TonB-linked outer membrane protein, SusC/RagA family [Flavobacterium micromati]
MRLKFKWIFTLLVALSMQFSFAQERTVSGVVSDATGPIPGANVLIKGTKKGVSTNFDGTYSITVNPGATLEFRSLGFLSQTKVVGTSSSINVTLATDAQSLNEVVVTSFGIKRDKKSLGYSTPVIKAKELTAARATNVTNQLVGKVAGVRVTGSGGAFSGSSVIIRGLTTFTGSNQPLYVVDGVPIDNSGGGTALQRGSSPSNRAIDINPEDIENVTVLKDAASTVLYGSRGASGVILITTKKGKKGEKATITFDSSYNIVNVNRLPDYQNEYAQGLNGTLTPAQIGSGLVPNRSNSVGLMNSASFGPKIMGQNIINAYGQPVVLQAYPNNVRDFFKTGFNAQNNLSFTGGSEKSSFRLALGNTRETSVIDNNNLSRTNITFSGNTQMSDRLNVGANITYTNTSSQRTVQGNNLSNPLFRGWFTPRSYDLTGLPFENSLGQQLYPGGEDNPYWTVKNNLSNDKVNRILANFNAKYELASWLSADLKIGTDFFNRNNRGFDEVGNRGAGFTQGAVNIGSVRENATNVHNLNQYFTLNANKKFNNFTLSGTVGNEFTNNYRFDSDVTGLNLVIPGFANLSNATTFAPSSDFAITKLFGVFADVALEYKNFLSVNVKARNDWDSTLAPENNSIFYPAVSGSFVLTEAFPAIKFGDKINLIKFRASAGEVGKGAPAFATDTYFNQALAEDGFGPRIVFPFNQNAGFSLSPQAGNAALTPEFTSEVAFGTEMAFFNNRLNIDATYYERNTRNVILSVPVSAASGVTNALRNAGKLSTKGLEIQVSGTPIKTQNFSWDLGANYTQYVSTVEELAPGVTNIFLGGFVSPSVRLVAGDEYGQLYGTTYQRNPAGQMLINPTTGLPLLAAGEVAIGNPNPDFTMGITNTFTYKNFSLFVLLDIKEGGDQYSRNIADLQRNGVAAETAEFPRFGADNVTPNRPYLYEGVFASGPNAGQPNNINVNAQDFYGNQGKYLAAEGFIYDTSWFRVREVAFSYNLNSRFLANTGIKQFEVGVFGRNLFLHAPNYPHLDPEQNALGISNAQGLEFNAQPQTRTIGFNLKVVL